MALTPTTLPDGSIVTVNSPAVSGAAGSRIDANDTSLATAVISLAARVALLEAMGTKHITGVQVGPSARQVTATFNTNISAADWLPSLFELYNGTWMAALTVTQGAANTLVFENTDDWSFLATGTPWRVAVAPTGYLAGSGESAGV